MRTHLEDIDSSQAGQWTEQHGFDDGQTWANDDGKTLIGLLGEQEGVERQERRIRFEDGDVLTLPVWRFPDGSGVVEIRAHWDLMGPDGRMEYAELVEGE